MPGGSRIALGVFSGDRLLGVVILGAGPSNGYQLVRPATMDDYAALTRLWLDDDLPKNSESRVLGVVLRHLKRHTRIKFLVTYADPAVGHVGTIYQATNWLYTGLSQAAAMLDLGDGIPRHSRSVAHAFGTHSPAHFASHGIDVKRIAQSAKHRYVYFLDRNWTQRLNVPVLPYPKAGQGDGHR
ncbi:MAG: DNA methyltransferase [Chloroflexi bacterium]|nr:DNA methyltransferase [Chloroflexota bacterium]